MPKHLTIESANPNHSAAFPGFGVGNQVTVPADVAARIVFAIFELTPSGVNASLLDRTVTPSGGAAATVTSGRAPAGLGGAMRIENTIVLGPGDAYYWDDASGGTATVTNVDYSYMDVS